MNVSDLDLILVALSNNPVSYGYIVFNIETLFAYGS